ncbi:MFS transporter [Cohnella caldifontis]|uniref:MFS transporter n=1 Tax=Cohnella caldifontis TaxID=3027471 RepID=UPI0023EC0550|nr:MFS transporter [Cohnella sp. YIM B05605]
MTLGNSMLIPILPAIEKHLNVSGLQSSMLITVYSVMAILFIPVAGYLSDRAGRKAVILPCLALAGAGGALCGFASGFHSNAYGWILAGRILQGLGAAGAMPIVIPLVGDLYREKEQVSAGLGIVETANTFGKVLSPIVGSALALWAWSVPFWSIPVFCAISILLVAFLVRKPKREQEKPLPFKTFIRSTFRLYLSKVRWITALFAIGGIGMFVLFGTLFYLSETLENEHHLKGILKGCVLAIPLTFLCLTSFIVGKCIGERKKLMKWLITFGFFLAAAAIAGCLAFPSVVGRMACLSAAGIGIGAALPCSDALITEGIEKEQRGTIGSLYSSMRFLGVAAGPPAASLLMRGSTSALFWTLAIASAASCLAALLAIRPGRKPEPESSPRLQRVQDLW